MAKKAKKIAKIWGQGGVTWLRWIDMGLGRVPSCSESKRTLGTADNRSPYIQNGWELNEGGRRGG